MRRLTISGVAALAAMLGGATAVAEAVATPPAPVSLPATPAPPIQVLIGNEGPQPTSQGTVLRLGPADADWSDLGAPILGGGAAGDDLTCLTQAVYYEARSESLAGQQAVAQVVMNRMHTAGFPKSVCRVVFERTGPYATCQFSFACDGAMDRLKEPSAWDMAQQVAQEALHGFVYKPLADAMHFHAVWVTPAWSATLPRLGRIGGHIFYR